MAFFTFIAFAYYHQTRDILAAATREADFSSSTVAGVFNRYNAEEYIPFTPRGGPEPKYDAPPGPPPSDDVRMSTGMNRDMNMNGSSSSLLGGNMRGDSMVDRMGPPGPASGDGMRMGMSGASGTEAMGGATRRDSGVSTYSMRAAPLGPGASDTTRMGISDPFSDFDRDTYRR